MTRMHSSRMRTGRSLTVCCSVLPEGGGVCLVPGGFSLVLGEGCLPGGGGWLPGRGGGGCLVQGGWLPGPGGGGCLVRGGFSGDLPC